MAFINHLEAFLKDNLPKPQTVSLHNNNFHICPHRPRCMCEIRPLIMKPIKPVQTSGSLYDVKLLCSLLSRHYETTHRCLKIQMVTFSGSYFVQVEFSATIIPSFKLSGFVTVFQGGCIVLYQFARI